MSALPNSPRKTSNRICPPPSPVPMLPLALKNRQPSRGAVGVEMAGSKTA